MISFVTVPYRGKYSGLIRVFIIKAFYFFAGGVGGESVDKDEVVLQDAYFIIEVFYFSVFFVRLTAIWVTKLNRNILFYFEKECYLCSSAPFYS